MQGLRFPPGPALMPQMAAQDGMAFASPSGVARPIQQLPARTDQLREMKSMVRRPHLHRRGTSRATNVLNRANGYSLQDTTLGGNWIRDDPGSPVAGSFDLFAATTKPRTSSPRDAIRWFRSNHASRREAYFRFRSSASPGRNHPFPSIGESGRQYDGVSLSPIKPDETYIS